MGYFEQQLEQALAAGFVAPVAQFIETDRDGHHSFCYPGAYGRTLAVIEHALGLLRQGAIDEALAYLAREHQLHEEVGRLWDEHRATRNARRCEQQLAGIAQSERPVIAAWRSGLEGVGANPTPRSTSRQGG